MNDCKKRTFNEKNNDEVNTIVNENIGLVKNYVFKNFSFCDDKDDLISAGKIGLIVAAKKFDPAIGTMFSTYAMNWIKKYVLAYINNNDLIRLSAKKKGICNKVKKLNQEYYETYGCEPNSTYIAEKLGITEAEVDEAKIYMTEILSLEVSYGDDENCSLCNIIQDKSCVDPCINIIEKENNDELRKIISNLPDNEREVIFKRFGLDDGIEKSLKEVGDCIGKSISQVSKYEKKALERLKNDEKFSIPLRNIMY